ncbi:Hint domain-containing protein [Pseudorhodobacter sp. W20_MBD10_FR17]|uniref:Hint domain-containing protein n=1 Tax=Pseudorhodobacter sp. W20_MBD10_FR17 TaxID=3240266 RepID=UPI003F9C51B5
MATINTGWGGGQDLGAASERWTTQSLNGNQASFIAGTMIATPKGARAVETLRSGDLVETVDNGPQRVSWVGGRSVIAQASALPVCISAGVLSNDRDLWLSGDHLVLLSGVDCQRLFREAEVLVAAAHLLRLPGVFRAVGVGRVSYHQLLLAQHQLVIADGIPAETLHLERQMSIVFPCRAAKVAANPAHDRVQAMPAARRVLQADEALALIGRRVVRQRIMRPADRCELGARAA